MIKRSFDLSFALVALISLTIPLALLAIVVRMTSKGPVIYWSKRVGKDNQLFMMPKFRTMHEGTPAVATHLLKRADTNLTRVGPFLRKSSLDELPQLWSIIKGEMSVVGPRPALFNQYDLIELRSSKGVDKLVPGLTGLAQVSGRDELLIHQKVEYDILYLENRSLALDLKIIVMTLQKFFMRANILH